MNIKSLAKRTLAPLWRRYENYLVKGFHRIYYNGRMGEGKIFKDTTWMGTPCLKCPLDMWIYQEILSEVCPDLIIETGTNEGGSALFLANMLDMLGNGNVVTIDILERARPQHPRIEYVTGSSSDVSLIDDVIGRRKFGSCMVILDSDHSTGHVSQELKLLSRYVTLGSYLIVEEPTSMAR
jgi:cephalosporin hydroxylase